MSEPDKKSCHNCRYLVREIESWEMPGVYWFECRARPANENLKQFPFENTTCKSHEPRMNWQAPTRGISFEGVELGL